MSFRPFHPHTAGTSRCRTRLARVVIAVGVLSVTLAVASASSADFLHEQLKSVGAKKQGVRQQIQRIDERTQVLTTRVAKYRTRIDALQRPIDDLQSQISALEAHIQANRDRIIRLKADYIRQRREIRRLSKELSIARDRLSQRMVLIYMDGNGVQSGAWLDGAAGVRQMLDRQEALSQVASVDVSVVDQIDGLKRSIRVKRANNHDQQDSIRRDSASVARDVAKVAAVKATYDDRMAKLQAAQHERDAYLAQLNSQQDLLDDQLEQLDEDSNAIRNAIANGGIITTNASGGLTSSGLIWSVNGPIVSGFGPRWGRMHEGVDIAVGTGTPIHAAASGVVVYATWMSGYGNMVIIQHSGNFATAYAHQSQIATANGQFVSQGQVIGFVGCTGHCFGPHLHFETRVGGSAVDPMRYL